MEAYAEQRRDESNLSLYRLGAHLPVYYEQPLLQC